MKRLMCGVAFLVSMVFSLNLQAQTSAAPRPPAGASNNGSPTETPASTAVSPPTADPAAKDNKTPSAAKSQPSAKDQQLPIGAAPTGTEPKPTGPLQINPNAPDRYTVVKGDTLWDISARFLSQPWRWEEIWGLNKEVVADPHWIYPGQVLFLIMTDQGPKLVATTPVGTSADGSTPPPNSDDSTTPPDSSGSATGDGAIEAGKPSSGVGVAERPGYKKLKPSIIVSNLDQAIPSIPQRIIEPFLSKPMLLAPGDLEKSPRIVGGNEGRFIVSSGDYIYATGLNSDQLSWKVYRPGRVLTDPATNAVLGQEADYLGSARLIQKGDLSTLQITESRREISANDYLLPTEPVNVIHYSPRAPAVSIESRVVSIVGGVNAGGSLSVISLAGGTAAGIEIGDVLALYRSSPAIHNFYQDKRTNFTPSDQRYGLVFVFRVYENVSYALVMNANWPVSRGDVLRNP